MKFLIFLFVLFFFVSTSEAQTAKGFLEKARKITLLKDDSIKVRGIMHDFVADDDPTDESDDFEIEDVSIEVFYGSGDCEEDDDAIWDAPMGIAYRVEIRWSSDITPSELGLDLVKYEKEQVYASNEELFIYHDKSAGFAVEVEEGLVLRVIIIPPKSSEIKICNTDFAREFISYKSWFGNKKLKDRVGIVCGNQYANVTALHLTREEVFNLGEKHIGIKVTASDPENDPLVYNYTVSAGKVIGSGAKVVWDLSGVGPGRYTITAGVDDGCGLCGTTQTRTVTIK